MSTKFKKEVTGLSVFYNGLLVANIYKMDKRQVNNPDIDWKYGLAYTNGRYEKFNHPRDAKDAAKKICGKLGITGKIVIY